MIKNWVLVVLCAAPLYGAPDVEDRQSLEVGHGVLQSGFTYYDAAWAVFVRKLDAIKIAHDARSYDDAWRLTDREYIKQLWQTRKDFIHKINAALRLMLAEVRDKEPLMTSLRCIAEDSYAKLFEYCTPLQKRMFNGFLNKSERSYLKNKEEYINIVRAFGESHFSKNVNFVTREVDPRIWGRP